MPAERRGERGTTIPLIIGLAVVLFTLVAVVTDATSAFVRRQGLDSLADGAALQGADLGTAASSAYPTTDDSERLREAEAAARRAVADYLRDAGAYSRYSGLSFEVAVDPGDRSVRVHLRAEIDLPVGVPGIVRRAPVEAAGTAAVTRD